MDSRTLSCEMYDKLYKIVDCLEYQIGSHYGRDVPKGLVLALSEARDAMALFEYVEDQREAELDAAEAST